MMKRPLLDLRPASVLMVPVLLTACDEHVAVGTLAPSAELAKDAPAPALVPFPGAGPAAWPYTGQNFSGTPQDPINLVFLGEADPRNVRNVLLSLNGSRGGPFAPFTCTWSDAIGGQQTTYAEPGGWTGSVVQLECGSYAPFRFHLRLFPAGDRTLGNAHVEILIPGTHDHQVLSWELGEQLVMFDIARSGYMADAPGQTGPINAAPTFRWIPPYLFNPLPYHLRAIAGGPSIEEAPEIDQPMGIPTNGSATILTLAAAPPAPGTSQAFVLPFGQRIPKPFCAEEDEWIRVDGPLHFHQEVRVSEAGVLTSQTVVDGALEVREYLEGGALGPRSEARVREEYQTLADGRHSFVKSARQQRIHSHGPPQMLKEQLQVGPGRQTNHRVDVKCR